MIAYIEKLLKGQPVEWKTLGEVAKIKRGERVTKSQLMPQGKYPVISGGAKPLGFFDHANRSRNTITIAQYGSAGYVDWQSRDFWANDVCYSIFPHSSIDNRFLYHVLLSKQSSIYSLITEAIPAHLPLHKLASISIPIPELLVQGDIVRILDKLMDLEADLEAELEAELEARRKQYEYYRNSLLSFDKPGGGGKIMYKPLEEVFSMRNGYTPSKSKKELWEGGSIPWYRMEDLRTGSRMLSDAIQHITPKAIKGKGLFQANSIVMATTATIGEHALLVVEGLANQQFTNFEIKTEYRKLLLPKFAYYYFFLIGAWCKQNTNVSSFPSVAISSLKNQTIPIPPLPEQRRIIRILDKFDTLAHSLSEGLPQEVELRRKQYEYYREQLLSFPKN
jgi:restriction modification system DNA specificity domain protein